VVVELVELVELVVVVVTGMILAATNSNSKSSQQSFNPE
jgi:hypothetical protein